MRREIIILLPILFILIFGGLLLLTFAFAQINQKHFGIIDDLREAGFNLTLIDESRVARQQIGNTIHMERLTREEIVQKLIPLLNETFRDKNLYVWIEVETEGGIYATDKIYLCFSDGGEIYRYIKIQVNEVNR